MPVQFLDVFVFLCPRYYFRLHGLLPPLVGWYTAPRRALCHTIFSFDVLGVYLLAGFNFFWRFLTFVRCLKLAISCRLVSGLLADYFGVSSIVFSNCFECLHYCQNTEYSL